ncbi:hypothetical protein [Streptomyces sp. KR55]|uniref:hypothetical protein n=1 Tax=Streptomyces sp. KR55 TaxID=3457425 RepID=UPI003FD4A001
MATAVSTPTDKPDEHEEAVPQIVQLDPALLVRDECNAREHDTEPDEKLTASVKELGVEETISARPRPDGTYGVSRAGGAPRRRRSPTPPPSRRAAPCARSRRSCVRTWSAVTAGRGSCPWSRTTTARA